MNRWYVIAVSAALALAGVLSSTQAAAQSKGIWLANLVDGDPDWGKFYRWNFLANGDYDTENMYGGAYDLAGFPSGTRPIGTYDFNGDGWSDTVFNVPDVFGPGQGQIMIVFNWFNTFTGVVSVLDPLPVGRHGIGVGDFDGDGVGDVLLDDGAGNLSVFLIKIDFNYWQKGLVNLASSVKSSVNRYAGFADVDGDGKADVLVRPKKLQLAFWKSTGTNVVRDSKNRPVQNPLADLISQMGSQGQMTVLGAMDWNGDGYDDLIMRRWIPTKSRWVIMRAYNDGSGAFPTWLQGELKVAFNKTPIGIGNF